MKKKMLMLLFLTAAPMVMTSCSGVIAATKDNPVYTLTLNPCTGKTSDYTYLKGHKGDEVNLEEYKVENESFVGWTREYLKAKKAGNPATDGLVKTYKFNEANEILYGAYKAGSGGQSEASKQYMNNLRNASDNNKANHLYYHYYRYENSANSYAPWDVWAWAYKPDASEGAKFDWKGRTPTDDGLSATGNATTDIAGAVIDIDLNATYKGGWDNNNRRIAGNDVTFTGAEEVGLQIVQSSTRTHQEGQFWTNDGSNLYIKLSDYAVELTGGGTAYHCFVVQDDVQNPSTYPVDNVEDPFANDDGTNITYGKNTYDNIDWKNAAGLQRTAVDFKDVGVGYQIMVSSFADSDGDGSGDIYGITQKLPYLKDLGVKALWLTPIQLSDSYHGYDITDYEQVDPKFGSKTSPAGVQNDGVVTKETALNDYKELISEAHNAGIKIVMDLVLNHTSTSNKWFVASANLDEEYRGYYQWGNHLVDKTHINQKNNWYPYGDHPYSYYAKFGSSMPELNFSYKSTREAVEDMSVYWVKLGVDGFRLDAVKHIFMENEVSSTAGDTIVYDKSTSGDYSSDLTKNLHFFKELKKVVTEQAGRDVFFVGENFDGHAYHVAPYYEAFDSLFDFYAYFNLTSAAATGRYNTDNKYGTAAGFMVNNSLYTVAADNLPNSGIRDSHGDFAKANNSEWNFVGVYKTYNKYRGETSLPGVFTSNHDIARVINRIAGSGAATGLEKQGNIKIVEWADYEVSANLVKFAELMLPGLTWIYYGDEIGMTGNFEDQTKTADDPYADLWYRQPMKWVTEGGAKGDDYGTTSYYVTGSSMLVKQDSVNKSSVVKGALNAQGKLDTTNEQLSAIIPFINAKTGKTDANAGKALRLGDIEVQYFASGDSLVANVLQFKRTYQGTTVKVAVNFNSTASYNLQGMGGTVLASYRGATTGKLPAYSAIVVKQ